MELWAKETRKDIRTGSTEKDDLGIMCPLSVSIASVTERSA